MNDSFESSLKAWNENEKAANELINIVGRLYKVRSQELMNQELADQKPLYEAKKGVIFDFYYLGVPTI